MENILYVHMYKNKPWLISMYMQRFMNVLNKNIWSYKDQFLDFGVQYPGKWIKIRENLREFAAKIHFFCALLI